MYPSSCSRHLQVSPNEAQAHANRVTVLNQYTHDAHFTNAVWLRLEHITFVWGFDNSSTPSKYDHSGPLTRYVKLQVAHAPEMPGTFSPPPISKGKPLVSDPFMHHDTCVTHVPWCLSGSLTRGDGENVPGIPGACATRNVTHLVRDPCTFKHVRNQLWESGIILIFLKRAFEQIE